MTETVTAIVATHNRPALLRTTLRTILWQNGVTLDVIVVDDGSDEDIAHVIDSCADRRVRLIREAVPQGVSAARNRGAREARGTWLAFCDDDDLWAPDKVAIQLEAARRSHRSWAYTGAVHVSLDLNVLSVRRPPPAEQLMTMLPRFNAIPGGASNVMVRAEMFAAAGGWDESLINLADWDLWQRLAAHGSPASVDRPLVGYRIHAGNASTDTALILMEARRMDARPGSQLDFGALHHYLAWVHLRTARRIPAMMHLARAALGGQWVNVARTVAALARGRVGRTIPALGPRRSNADRAWLAEAECWLQPLRRDG